MKILHIKVVSVFIFLLLAIAVCLGQNEEWIRRYNGPANLSDNAIAIAVDDSGNVYVVGTSENEYATIKYNSFGDALWVRRYGETGFGGNKATAMALDSSGNVIVTGTSGGNYATIKYSPSGDILWVRRYNGPGDGVDQAAAIAIDRSNNVLITGTSRGDYATIKYNSVGEILWVRRYGKSSFANNKATAIAVDDSGNVYVTGTSWDIGLDYTTIKYNSMGDTLWVRRYNGPGNDDDEATAIAVDNSGNVYVTGRSYEPSSNLDYMTIKYNSMGDTLWVRRYNGPGNGDDEATAIAVDDSNNVYVTGMSLGLNTLGDYATIKYNSMGDTLWVRRYNGPGDGDDEATAMAVDNSNNVYITGMSLGLNTLGDYATIMYNSSGEMLWVKRYDGPARRVDQASAICVDTRGNVYVTGTSWDIGFDYATIKYSTATVVEEQLFPLQDNSFLEVFPIPSIQELVIRYRLLVNGKVTLKVYDMVGNLVNIFVDRNEEAGYHSIKWDTKDILPGIYYAVLETDTFQAIKMTLVTK